VNSDAIRRYAERPWARIEASRREYRAREIAEYGLDAAFRAAHALWLHMRCVRPEWPGEEERNEDLAHHVALRRDLDRAGRALAGR
jgi:hypothetical protein